VHGAEVSREQGTRGLAGARHGDLWICVAAEHRRAVVRVLWGTKGQNTWLESAEGAAELPDHGGAEAAPLRAPIRGGG
jgi:hypothetical protein